MKTCKIRIFAPLIGIAICVVTAGCSTSTTQATTSNSDITWASTGGKKLKSADLLFVQNARGVRFNKDQMTLTGVQPVTVAFSDRPERLAGHMPTSKLIPLWSEGRDSFLKDPPNATLSVLGDKKVSSVVVELRNPRLAGGDLTYDVQILEGSPPDHGGATSLFIDVIGMPLTPMSYAGAARRAYRGGAYYAGGYNGPAVVNYGGYGGGGYGYASGARGTAAWGGGSGYAQGWRGNTVAWRR
jgi:hypothetical protein